MDARRTAVIYVTPAHIHVNTAHIEVTTAHIYVAPAKAGAQVDRR